MRAIKPASFWRENVIAVVIRPESFRFLDENDYESEIFLILSSARAWSSDILAGKHDCRRHATTSLGENVVVTETSYKVLEVFSFFGREMA